MTYFLNNQSVAGVSYSHFRNYERHALCFKEMICLSNYFLKKTEKIKMTLPSAGGDFIDVKSLNSPLLLMSCQSI